MSDVWLDPRVKDALAQGRAADDICIMECPSCQQLGYYNQGSHFTCLECNVTFNCVSEHNSEDDVAGPLVYIENAHFLGDWTNPPQDYSHYR
jgi:hypothetical protein